jgi:DNA-binding IclR family transcriptional regulator
VSQPERLLGLLALRPGLHLRELPRHLGVSLNTVRYHLDTLMREGLVAEHRTGRFVRYFRSDAPAQTDRALIAALRVGGQRRLLQALVRKGPCGFNSLQRETALPPATLSLYLTMLHRERLVDHEENGPYSLSDTAWVQERLTLYTSRFPDLLADAAVEIFG